MSGFGLRGYSLAGNIRRELLSHSFEPFLCSRHMDWIVEPALRSRFGVVRVEGGKRRIAAFEEVNIVHRVRGCVFGALQQPARIPAPAPFI